MEIIPIIAKLLEDKALEEGEEYEYIPMQELEVRGQHTFLLQRRGNMLLPYWQIKLSPSKLRN